MMVKLWINFNICCYGFVKYFDKSDVMGASKLKVKWKVPHFSEIFCQCCIIHVSCFFAKFLHCCGSLGKLSGCKFDSESAQRLSEICLYLSIPAWRHASYLNNFLMFNTFCRPIKRQATFRVLQQVAMTINFSPVMRIGDIFFRHGCLRGLFPGSTVPYVDACS